MTTAEQWTSRRSIRARRLWTIRAKTPVEHRHAVRALLRSHRSWAGGVPPKPTKAELLAYADSLERSARGFRESVGSHDTETYSACGHDDYCIEAAVEYAKAAEQVRYEVMGGHYVR